MMCKFAKEKGILLRVTHLVNRLALAATGSTDGTISIWDVQTQRLRQTLNHEVKTCGS